MPHTHTFWKAESLSRVMRKCQARFLGEGRYGDILPLPDNACVSHRSTQYKQFGKSINYFDQQNCLPEFKECWIEYKELGSHALQATVKRVDYGFCRFFKLKSGYPKFKSSRKYKGWTYPCKSGWKACTSGKNGYLKLTN